MDVLGDPWDIPTLCQLIVSYCISIEELEQLWEFPSETLVTLGVKTCLAHFMGIEEPLDFNMLLGCDYFCSMKIVVSTFFCVM